MKLQLSSAMRLPSPANLPSHKFASKIRLAQEALRPSPGEWRRPLARLSRNGPRLRPPPSSNHLSCARAPALSAERRAESPLALPPAPVLASRWANPATPKGQPQRPRRARGRPRPTARPRLPKARSRPHLARQPSHNKRLQKNTETPRPSARPRTLPC